MDSIKELCNKIPEDLYAGIVSLFTLWVLVGLVYSPILIKIAGGLTLALLSGILTSKFVTLKRQYKKDRYKNATQDELTHVYNSDYFEDISKREMKACLRHQDTLSIVVFEIDEMDKIQLRWGKKVADKALVNLCSNIKDKTRSVDIFARIKGSEFVILCPATDHEITETLAERIRLITKSLVITDNETDDEINFTCSVAIAQYSPEKDRVFDDMLARAKARL